MRPAGWTLSPGRDRRPSGAESEIRPERSRVVALCPGVNSLRPLYEIDAPRQRVEEIISPVYAERSDKSGVRSQLAYELVGERTTRVVVTVYERLSKK